MTFSTRGIFQFDFDFTYTEGENAPPAVKGFAFDFAHRIHEALEQGMLAESSQPGVLVFSMDDENPYSDKMSELEGEYGVHDLYGFSDPAFISLGISTYECERNRMGFLLQDWRNWFVEHCDVVGEIRDIDPNIQEPEKLWEELTK